MSKPKQYNNSDMEQRTTNRNCRSHVDNRTPFKGSHLSARYSSGVYVVYSYGWWPIYAYIEGQWYGHKEGYSHSTAVHKTHAYPSGNIIMLEGVEELRKMIDGNRD
jgi:hypothetical protein|tara:strand:+ start:310 stop:627 length:318 start_codon:yes stop_codon:yes gene_type:complete